MSGVQGTGVAGFEPFLQTAAFITALEQVQLLIKQFESPYQQAVRDATLQSFDEQAAARQQQIRDQAAACDGCIWWR